MKAQSEQCISLRCIDANDESNPLNGRILNLTIWKYSENGGNFLASSYSQSVMYFAYKNGSTFNGWYSFSDDATVLAHVISPVTMNDTVDINTGYVDLNFPLNEYFFFKFVCAAGNVPSAGNLYEENMMVGFSYYVPCGKGYIRFNIESFTRINILENTSGYNFRYIKALKK